MVDIDEKAIIGRIMMLRTQYAGMRGKSKFSRALGISASTYNYYEKTRVPPIEIILKICELTGADIHWVLTGERSEKRRGILTANDFSVGVNSALLRKVDSLLNENPDLTESILTFIELLNEKKGYGKEFVSYINKFDALKGDISFERHHQGWIPLIGSTTTGIINFFNESDIPNNEFVFNQIEKIVEEHTSKAVINFYETTLTIDMQSKRIIGGLRKCKANLVQFSGEKEDEVYEFIYCEQLHKIYQGCLALHVSGDSMSPKINDGDVVIVNPSVLAKNGCISIICAMEHIGITCKIFRKKKENIHLIPINEKYETKRINLNDIDWALSVLCHIKIL